MKYPFFASIVILCLLLMYQIHRHRDKESKAYDAFLDREREANSTRRKPLNDLIFIKIPLDTLPVNILSDNEKVSDYLSTLNDLSATEIINLTGISNTDLKLKYGAPNIDRLIRADQAYTMLVRTLNDWGVFLYKQGYPDEAAVVLEYSVSTGTDVTATYDTLAQIYISRNQKEKIKELIPFAEKTNSLLTENIVNKLKAYSDTPDILP